MKKQLLLIAFCLFFVNSYAQRFNAGLLFGVTGSHTTGTLEDSVIFESPAMFNKAFSKPGITAGGFTNFYLTDNSILDLSVAYTLKGSRKVPTKADSIPNIVYESQLNLHYITLPIHYRYEMNDYWTIFAGPNIGFLIGHKFTQNYMNFSHLYKYALIDFSIDLGMGITVIKNLYLDINYSSTFFLTPIRSYKNNMSWKFGPFSKQFWQRGQCNRLVAFTLRWTIWGREGEDGILEKY